MRWTCAAATSGRVSRMTLTSWKRAKVAAVAGLLRPAIAANCSKRWITRSHIVAFEKPRILTDSEANTIRGKCLMVGHPRLGPTAAEVMLLIGHFDLVDMKLRSALETLSSCMPPK